MTTRYSISCPQCGYRIDQSSGNYSLTYGDPRSTCPSCGLSYNNTWVVELAFLPKEWYVKNYRKRWVLLLLFFLSIALPLLSLSVLTKDNIWVLFIIMALSVAMIIYALIYKSKTTPISVREVGFDKKYEESEKRLANESYKQSLIDSGYYKTMMQNIKH